jgi:hypothetical protein
MLSLLSSAINPKFSFCRHSWKYVLVTYNVLLLLLRSESIKEEIFHTGKIKIKILDHQSIPILMIILLDETNKKTNNGEKQNKQSLKHDDLLLNLPTTYEATKRTTKKITLLICTYT